MVRALRFQEQAQQQQQPPAAQAVPPAGRPAEQIAALQQQLAAMQQQRVHDTQVKEVQRERRAAQDAQAELQRRTAADEERKRLEALQARMQQTEQAHGHREQLAQTGQAQRQLEKAQRDQQQQEQLRRMQGMIEELQAQNRHVQEQHQLAAQRAELAMRKREQEVTKQLQQAQRVGDVQAMQDADGMLATRAGQMRQLEELLAQLVRDMDEQQQRDPEARLQTIKRLMQLGVEYAQLYVYVDPSSAASASSATSTLSGRVASLALSDAVRHSVSDVVQQAMALVYRQNAATITSLSSAASLVQQAAAGCRKVAAAIGAGDRASLAAVLEQSYRLLDVCKHIVGVVAPAVATGQSALQLQPVAAEEAGGDVEMLDTDEAETDTQARLLMAEVAPDWMVPEQRRIVMVTAQQSLATLRVVLEQTGLLMTGTGSEGMVRSLPRRVSHLGRLAQLGLEYVTVYRQLARPRGTAPSTVKQALELMRAESQPERAAVAALAEQVPSLLAGEEVRTVQQLREQAVDARDAFTTLAQKLRIAVQKPSLSKLLGACTQLLGSTLSIAQAAQPWRSGSAKQQERMAAAHYVAAQSSSGDESMEGDALALDDALDGLLMAQTAVAGLSSALVQLGDHHLLQATPSSPAFDITDAMQALMRTMACGLWYMELFGVVDNRYMQQREVLLQLTYTSGATAAVQQTESAGFMHKYVAATRTLLYGNGRSGTAEIAVADVNAVQVVVDEVLQALCRGNQGIAAEWRAQLAHSDAVVPAAVLRKAVEVLEQADAVADAVVNSADGGASTSVAASDAGGAALLRRLADGLQALHDIEAGIGPMLQLTDKDYATRRSLRDKASALRTEPVQNALVYAWRVAAEYAQMACTRFGVGAPVTGQSERDYIEQAARFPEQLGAKRLYSTVLEPLRQLVVRNDIDAATIDALGTHVKALATQRDALLQRLHMSAQRPLPTWETALSRAGRVLQLAHEAAVAASSWDTPSEPTQIGPDWTMQQLRGAAVALAYLRDIGKQLDGVAGLVKQGAVAAGAPLPVAAAVWQQAATNLGAQVQRITALVPTEERTSATQYDALAPVQAALELLQGVLQRATEQGGLPRSAPAQRQMAMTDRMRRLQELTALGIEYANAFALVDSSSHHGDWAAMEKRVQGLAAAEDQRTAFSGLLRAVVQLLQGGRATASTPTATVNSMQQTAADAIAAIDKLATAACGGDAQQAAQWQKQASTSVSTVATMAATLLQAAADEAAKLQRGGTLVGADAAAIHRVFQTAIRGLGAFVANTDRTVGGLLRKYSTKAVGAGLHATAELLQDAGVLQTVSNACELAAQYAVAAERVFGVGEQQQQQRAAGPSAELTGPHIATQIARVAADAAQAPPQVFAQLILPLMKLLLPEAAAMTRVNALHERLQELDTALRNIKQQLRMRDGDSYATTVQTASDVLADALNVAKAAVSWDDTAALDVANATAMQTRLRQSTAVLGLLKQIGAAFNRVGQLLTKQPLVRAAASLQDATGAWHTFAKLLCTDVEETVRLAPVVDKAPTLLTPVRETLRQLATVLQYARQQQVLPLDETVWQKMAPADRMLRVQQLAVMGVAYAAAFAVVDRRCAGDWSAMDARVTALGNGGAGADATRAHLRLLLVALKQVLQCGRGVPAETEQDATVDMLSARAMATVRALDMLATATCYGDAAVATDVYRRLPEGGVDMAAVVATSATSALDGARELVRSALLSPSESGPPASLELLLEQLPRVQTTAQVLRGALPQVLQALSHQSGLVATMSVTGMSEALQTALSQAAVREALRFMGPRSTGDAEVQTLLRLCDGLSLRIDSGSGAVNGVRVQLQRAAAPAVAGSSTGGDDVRMVDIVRDMLALASSNECVARAVQAFYGTDDVDDPTSAIATAHWRFMTGARQLQQMERQLLTTLPPHGQDARQYQQQASQPAVRPQTECVGTLQALYLRLARAIEEFDGQQPAVEYDRVRVSLSSSMEAALVLAVWSLRMWNNTVYLPTQRSMQQLWDLMLHNAVSTRDNGLWQLLPRQPAAVIPGSAVGGGRMAVRTSGWESRPYTNAPAREQDEEDPFGGGDGRADTERPARSVAPSDEQYELNKARIAEARRALLSARGS